MITRKNKIKPFIYYAPSNVLSIRSCYNIINMHMVSIRVFYSFVVVMNLIILSASCLLFVMINISCRGNEVQSELLMPIFCRHIRDVQIFLTIS